MHSTVVLWNLFDMPVTLLEFDLILDNSHMSGWQLNCKLQGKPHHKTKTIKGKMFLLLFNCDPDVHVSSKVKSNNKVQTLGLSHAAKCALGCVLEPSSFFVSVWDATAHTEEGRFFSSYVRYKVQIWYALQLLCMRYLSQSSEVHGGRLLQ